MNTRQWQCPVGPLTVNPSLACWVAEVCGLVALGPASFHRPWLDRLRLRHASYELVLDRLPSRLGDTKVGRYFALG